MVEWCVRSEKRGREGLITMISQHNPHDAGAHQKKCCPPLSSTHQFRLCLDPRHVSSRHTAQTGFNHDMTGRGSEGGRERKPHVDWARLPKAETTSMRCGHHISTRVCMGTKLARQLRQRSAGEVRDWSGEDEGLSRNWDATISFPRLRWLFCISMTKNQWDGDM